MATSLEESEKLDWTDNIHTDTSHLVKKIVKIGPVDPEIALLNLKKKKEINVSKIYSLVGRFAERAKLHICLNSSANWLHNIKMYKNKQQNKRLQ